MSTLAVVEEILRAAKEPKSVREIVELAGAALPSKSKTPDTVVARDLSMDIKRKAESSLFVRASPGRYTLRSLLAQIDGAAASSVTLLHPTAALPTQSPPGQPLQSSPPTAMSQALGGERVGTRPAPAVASKRIEDSSMVG